MKQYLDLLQRILDEGCEKESGRPNMPHTWGIEDGEIKMDLREGFPLLTTKQMFWKGIVHELLWFLRGETNIKYLVDNGVNIWNDDAYRWYTKYCDMLEMGYMSQEEFIKRIKEGNLKAERISEKVYVLGDLGKVYGYQWRNQNGVDQIAEIIDGLTTNPYSRYHVLDSWNKADFPEMALPPCHLLYQFIVRPMTLEQRQDWASWEFDNLRDWKEKELDKLGVPKFHLNLNMYQRSVDSGLGLCWNLPSMSLLLMIISKTVNMIPRKATWIGGDTHIYMNHIDGVKEQLKRIPYDLPKMKINKDLNSLKDIENLTIDDFELIGYESHPPIKLKLSVGL